MKKQIISGILALTMVIGAGVAPTGSKVSDLTNNTITADAGGWELEYTDSKKVLTTSDGKYNYKLNEDGTVEFAGYNGNSSTLTIPSTLGGRKVTVIGDNAFAYRDSITSVTIPSGVTTIEGVAFGGCINLKNVSIPATVKSIGDYAFAHCESLAGITLPNSLKNIGNSAFWDCTSLKSVKIPDSTTTIGAWAFNECTSLQSVIIGKSVKSIGEKAFEELYFNEEGHPEFNGDDFVTVAIKSLKLYCLKGTYAEEYAKKNGIKYEYITALSTPTPKISNGASGVNVSWTKSSGASSYNVYRRTSGESWTKIATVDASKLSYTDKNVYSGTTYYYTVKAVSDASTSGFVSTSALKFLRMPVVKSENASSGVKVSWSKTGCSSGYYVYRRTDSTSWTKIKTLSGSNSLSYTDTTASSGTTYYYTVRAYSGNTTSTFKSISALKFLRMPVVKTENASNGVKVSWSKTGCSSGYYVYRRTDSTSWTKIKTLSGSNSLSYTDTTASSGTTYYYTVRAYSGNTTSTFKSSSALKFLRMPVAKAENTSNGIKVSWSKTGCSSGYYVYRRTDSTSWTKIKTLSGSNSLSYTDTTASSGTTYYYTVRAYSGNTTSTFKSSSALKFLRMPVAKAENTSNGIKVSWSKTGCSSGYYVYRKTDSTSWTKIKTLSGSNSLSYTDTTAKPGTTYYYTVKSYSGKTASAFKSTSAIKRIKKIHFILNKASNCIHVITECRAAEKILPDNYAEIDLSEDELEKYSGIYWACGICSSLYANTLPKL